MCLTKTLGIRFVLDLDIAAPKITIPTDFCPDSGFPTKLMLDLGNLIIRSKVYSVIFNVDFRQNIVNHVCLIYSVL